MDYGLNGSQSCGVKAGGDQDALAPQPVPSQLVGKGRMLCCPWCPSVYAWGYTVRCCGDLVLWSPQALPWVSPPSLTELTDTLAFSQHLVLQHTTDFWIFLPTPSMDRGGTWKGDLHWPHGPCLVIVLWKSAGFSEADGCCREYSVTLFVILLASFTLINSYPLKILWLHCPHFSSSSLCLQYLFHFSFIYSLAL